MNTFRLDFTFGCSLFNWWMEISFFCFRFLLSLYMLYYLYCTLLLYLFMYKLDLHMEWGWKIRRWFYSLNVLKQYETNRTDLKQSNILALMDSSPMKMNGQKRGTATTLHIHILENIPCLPGRKLNLLHIYCSNGIYFISHICKMFFFSLCFVLKRKSNAKPAPKFNVMTSILFIRTMKQEYKRNKNFRLFTLALFSKGISLLTIFILNIFFGFFASSFFFYPSVFLCFLIERKFLLFSFSVFLLWSLHCSDWNKYLHII